MYKTNIHDSLYTYILIWTYIRMYIVYYAIQPFEIGAIIYYI